MGQPDLRLGHRPALDGLRGLAVALVVVFHFGALLDTGQRPMAGGYVGVDLFFVLSGFLITTLLLERHEDGERGLGAFYRRRALRLVPAVVGMLLVSGAIIVALSPSQWRATVYSSVTTLLYVGNWAQIHGGFSAYLGQVWSLAIEEQFYLVWPGVLLGLLALGVRRRSVLRGCLVTAVLALVWRAHLWMNHSWGQAYYHTEVRADALLIGAALALSAPLVWLPTVERRTIERTGLVAITLYLLAALGAPDAWMALGGFTIVALAAAGLIAVAIHGDAPPASWLTWGPLAALGRVSYGVYLWHYPIFALIRVHGPHPIAARFVLGFGLTALATAVSWWLIETPALTLKRRLDKAKAPGLPGALL